MENDSIEIPEIVRNGRNILLMTLGKTRFVDSLNYMCMKLSKLPKAFGLDESLAKGYFPHLFSSVENENYVGPLPAPEFYGLEMMTNDEQEKFFEWYNEHSQDIFDMKRDMIKYCKMDVKILWLACARFREIFLKVVSVCPFSEAVTLASACNLVFRKKFLAPQRIGILPSNGYRRVDKHSQKAIEYLLWVEKTYGRQLEHAGRGREHVLPNRKKADGYLPPLPGDNHRGRVFEFHGCWCHGCPRCYPRNRNERKVYNQSMNHVYEKTIAKAQQIRDMGYEYKEIWEHEWDRLRKTIAIKNYLRV